MSVVKVFRLALLVLVAACASQEILEPRSAAAPEFIDFSGNWQLRRDSAADRERINRAISKAAGDNVDIIPIPPEAGRSGQGSRRTPPRQGGGLVQVFLESGENLKITQTAHGIFISFDRSVVEEYRFGENRTINVGEIEAQRVSGWDGDRYVVETLDRKGMKLTEQFYLSEDGQTLHRLIVLRNRDNTDVTMRQSFSRED